MRLAECSSADVVQNIGNGRFYRFERPEGERSRIRPLELFPNGLLIAKPTDTIVEAGLLVRFVDRWAEELYVVVQPGDTKTRRTYEKERARKRLELQQLQIEALLIDPKQRGSHANKVNAVEARLKVLNRGLTDNKRTPASASPMQSPSLLTPGQVVQLPSGLAARFMGSTRGGVEDLATVCNAAGCFVVNPEVLRPIENRWISTV